MNSFDMNEVFASVEAKFNAYKELIRGVAQQRIRHLFVYGKPGLGKSFEAEHILKHNQRAKHIRYHRSAGHVTPLSLYHNLYDWRRRGEILLFDDCDTAFENEQCLNILKAATDTRDTRAISWGSSSKLVRVREFIYEGSLIIITNVDFNKPRYISLNDRVLGYKFDLTPEEIVARVIDIIRKEHKYSHLHDEIMVWLIQNYHRLGEVLTIRTAMKALELAAYNRDNWKELAEATIMGVL